MPYWISLAFKNVFRQKKRSFTLGINYLFIALVLMLVLSFSQGVKKNISDNIISSTAGHLTISGEYVVSGRVFQGVAGFDRVEKALRDAAAQAGEDVRIITRYTVRSAVYYKGLSKRLQFVGINEPQDRGFKGQLLFVAGSWEAFAANPNGVLLPRELADYYGLVLGDELVVSTRSRFGAFNTGTIKVEGIYETGNFFVQGYVVSHFEAMQQLDLSDDKTASTVYAYYNDSSRLNERREAVSKLLKEAGFEVFKPENDEAAIAAVSAASPRYRMEDPNRTVARLTISTLDEVLGLVRTVLATVNAIGGLVAGIMLFIIAVSIFINMRMTINDRLGEIGTLRAIGTESRDVTSLFLIENVFLSLVFVAGGILASLMVMLMVGTLLQLPPTGPLALFLDEGRFVFVPQVADILGIVVALALFTALFSWLPARRGGKIRAVEALSKTF